ncbi:hypothetical protein [Desulfosporosinus nitroreducens]|uniref:Uncharacterized protein n=1 Tax=Desulfosporosinus nitroreducens TaxID=2018668 RepID=A0ABT8QSE9_9FIRM|nr:hypothetical protein [Desulfosporosinus nitroreducens]MCO1599963.1 hypothetical protein [Desulfosporosinus nitroreducens]MDO0822993.1 hypothetical protein [Desulfosporosinus nitroreducens]
MSQKAKEQEKLSLAFLALCVFSSKINNVSVVQDKNAQQDRTPAALAVPLMDELDFPAMAAVRSRNNELLKLLN